MKPAILIPLALLLTAAHGFTQERKPSSLTELAAYRGPDRESILYAGAKTEGKVTWYTSLAGASYKELAKAFSTRYPGVEVEPFRAPGASKGARVEWIPMDLVPTNVGSAAIAANPPHPHAALLMADFLLSPEGQGLLAKFYYGSAAKAQPFKEWRPEHGLTTEQYEKKLSHCDDLLNFIAHR